MCTDNFGRDKFILRRNHSTHMTEKGPRSRNNGRTRDYNGKQAKYEFAM